MPAFARQELEEMIRRWVVANDEAGRTGDWSKMSQFYTEDAIYTWNNGQKWEFVARGRKQIHEWAFGSEMAGLEHAHLVAFAREQCGRLRAAHAVALTQIEIDRDTHGSLR